jgi:hypothetical protein
MVWVNGVTKLCVLATSKFPQNHIPERNLLDIEALEWASRFGTSILDIFLILNLTILYRQKAQ